MTNAATKPATSGKCGVVGCTHAADLETSRRTGPNSWTVSKSCLGHASEAELIWLIEVTTGDEFDAIVDASEA